MDREGVCVICLCFKEASLSGTQCAQYRWDEMYCPPLCTRANLQHRALFCSFPLVTGEILNWHIYVLIFSAFLFSLPAAAWYIPAIFKETFFFFFLFTTKQTKTSSRHSESSNLYLFPCVASTAGNICILVPAVFPHLSQTPRLRWPLQCRLQWVMELLRFSDNPDPDPLVALVSLIHLPSPTGCDVLCGDRIKQVWINKFRAFCHGCQHGTSGEWDINNPVLGRHVVLP